MRCGLVTASAVIKSHVTAHFSYPLPALLSPGTPKHINYEAVKEDLEEIDGVKQAHSLHIWSLTLNKIALAAHLVLGEERKLACTPLTRRTS